MGFERLAAGVIVIGLILWGASILATPDELREAPAVDPVAAGDPDPLEDMPAVPEPDEADEPDEDDQEEQPAESSGRRRKKDGG